MIGAAGHFRLIKNLDPADITRDEAMAALHSVEGILSTCLCCRLEKAEGEELPFEGAMASLLMSEWAGATKPTVESAIQKLLENAGDLTDNEVADLLNFIDTEMNSKFGPGVDEKLSGIITSGYADGKRQALKRLGREMQRLTAIDTTVTDWLTNHHLYWVHNFYNRHLSEKLALHIANGLAEGLGREGIGQRLKGFFSSYPGISNKPDNYWRGLAANGMNRSRNFAAVQAYADIQVTELEIVAILDERTSPVCMELNGRIIPVSACVEQRDAMMAAENPEDVKNIAPWLTPDQVRARAGIDTGAIPTQAFIDQNMILPPYHFHCRTGVVERKRSV